MARARTETAGAGGLAGMRSPAAAVLGPQMRQFWKAQERILTEAEDFARHWFARRHEAALGALRACEQAARVNPADAAGALQAFRDWQARSAERMAEDMREWAELWARCATHLVNSEVGAGAETIEEIQRETADLRAKHATPV